MMPKCPCHDHFFDYHCSRLLQRKSHSNITEQLYLLISTYHDLRRSFAVNDCDFLLYVNHRVARYIAVSGFLANLDVPAV